MPGSFESIELIKIKGKQAVRANAYGSDSDESILGYLQDAMRESGLDGSDSFALSEIVANSRTYRSKGIEVDITTFITPDADRKRVCVRLPGRGRAKKLYKVIGD